MKLLCHKILFCFLGVLFCPNISARYTNVKIQSVTSGSFLSAAATSFVNLGFASDDSLSVIWQIDWDAGISNGTFIRTNINGRTYFLVDFAYLLDDPIPSDKWTIDSIYVAKTGRYHHQFRPLTANTTCMNGPVSIPIGGPAVIPVSPSQFLSPCIYGQRQQEFFVSYVS